MKKRVVTKIGDVFSVTFDDRSKKYFQLIAFDLTQLNSDVIRAFKEKYPIDAAPDFDEVVGGEVEFYAHCVTKWGVQLGYWEKVGKSKEIGRIDDILFRGTGDYPRRPGAESVRISNDWHVWRIGDERFTKVGRLEGEFRKAEIGLVFTPEDIVDRIKTGEYDLRTYPSFE